MNHRLDQYLWNIEDCLRALPDADRKTEVSEIGQHLTVLIAAGVSDGQTEDAATRAAIHQFGTAREIGKRLARAKNRKRFALMRETVLFCLVFYTLYATGEQGVTQLWNRFSPPEPSRYDDYKLTVLFETVGLAAFLTLIARYGKQGVWHKAWHNTSPINAALRFAALELLVRQAGMVGWSMVESRIKIKSFPLGPFVCMILCHFLFCGLIAYLVGRMSKSPKNVVDTVTVAAAFLPVTGLLAATIEYLPTLTEFIASPLGPLAGVALWIIPGTLFVSIVRFGVQIGEKSRRAFVPVSYEGNCYESAT